MMRRLLYIAAALSCLLLVSCKADSSTAPASPAASETQTEAAETETTPRSDETETTETKYPRYSSDDGVSYYEINCPVVPAAEAGAAVTRLELPSEINGKMVQIDGFLDEETLIVQLADNPGKSSEIGTIPLKNGKAGEYQQLLELKPEQSANLLSERWVFISEPSETIDPFSNMTSIDYRMYDLQKKKLLQPFYTAKSSHGCFLPASGFSHSPLLVGDMLYFDDVIREDGEYNGTIYGYDTARGKIIETYPECQQPLFYQGQLIGRTKNEAGCDQRLISLKDNGKSFRKDFSNLTNAIASPESLFAVIEAERNPVFDDDPDQGYLPVSKLLDLTSGQEIFTTIPFTPEDNAISVSDRLAGWSLNSPMRVALYDIREQRLISFDKVVRSVDDPNYFDDNNYYRYANEYVSGNTSLILLGNSVTANQEALLVKIPSKLDVQETTVP